MIRITLEIHKSEISLYELNTYKLNEEIHKLQFTFTKYQIERIVQLKIVEHQWRLIIQGFVSRMWFMH